MAIVTCNSKITDAYRDANLTTMRSWIRRLTGFRYEINFMNI